MPGTGKGADKAAGATNADVLDLSPDVDVDTGAEANEPDNSEKPEVALDLEGDQESGEEAEGEETEATDDGTAAWEERERKLQLIIDKQGNELGPLRKIVARLLDRVNKAQIGGPTAEEWASNPDEAAKADQALKDEQEQLTNESRKAEMQSILARLAPSYERNHPELVKFLEKQGKVRPEFLEAYKADPYALSPGEAYHLNGHFEAEQKLERVMKENQMLKDRLNGKQPVTPPADAARKFAPTNDRTGKAPAPDKGPLTLEKLQRMAENDDPELEELLLDLPKDQLEKLMQAQDRSARKGPRRR